MEYDFRKVEKDWQSYWAEKKTFKTENTSTKPKYYVLDMFPYPSGAGLHVGHPLGYIASDIFARYKRLKGFNVLHPMGYDSFGLPAEQYAIQTGQHPSKTTSINIDGCLDSDGNIKKEFLDENGNIKKEAINNEGEIIQGYRKQLDKIGFSFDWDREVRTSNADYYKWTQWIFIQLFNSWYNPETNKAEPIEKLIEKFKVQSSKFKVGNTEKKFEELSEKEKSDLLLEYRLAYLSDTMVNWCSQLGTVLANEEVKDGVSERGGYPVERKLMKQWSLRITAYADRLLNDLDALDWTESIKEAQRNWIGRSEGSSLKFKVQPRLLSGSRLDEAFIEVFTTRPDTIFGVSFVTLAPEHDLVKEITTPEQKTAVEEYITFAKNRSERERMADVKKITGVFTGSYVIHPFTGKQIPIWIGDYVLASYGTGVVMAVPAHDSRDYAFASHFGIEKKVIIQPKVDWDFALNSYDEKEGKLVNSDFLNGLEVKAAIKKVIAVIEEKKLGKGKTNFRLRDAIFGRQRYWGEPIPVYYVPAEANAKEGENLIPKVLSENELPLILPEVDKYLPTESGEPPLARASSSWKKDGKYDYEYSTMPGWAGSSWYFLRYMDAHNEKKFASKEAVNYWQNIDLYIGGAEHATGHLLYVRFWTKFLFDLGLIPCDEPAKKLINQGMIQGVSEIKKQIKNITYNAIEKNGKAYINLNAISTSIKEIDLIFNDINSENILIDFKKHLNIFISKDYNLADDSNTIESHVPIIYCNNSILNTEEYDSFRIDKDSEANIYISKSGIKFGNHYINCTSNEFKFFTRPEVEKMSKSKWNVVTPDLMVEQYGADCLRLYEMFLGPLEQSKPWNTNGISGVSNFIRKLWRLYHTGDVYNVTEEPATKPELKTLHKTIKKIAYDIENFSFNTSVSNFMICVNELTELKCNKREILEPLAILISPYAPHIAEELWKKLGHTESITYATFPVCNEEYLIESSFNYPISFNGKTRFFQEYDRSLSKEDVEKEVMTLEQTHKYLEGKAPKKIIVVHNKIVNIVI